MHPEELRFEMDADEYAEHEAYVEASYEMEAD